MAKNILIFVNSLGIGGGAERIAAEIGTQLHKKGYGVFFLERYRVKKRYDFSGKLITLFDQKSNNFVKKYLRILTTPMKLSKICKKHDIDTVISFLTFQNYMAVMSRIAFNNKAKLILSERCNPSISKSKSKLDYKGYMYSKSDKVVALSRQVEEILKKEFSLDNTITIYNLQNVNDFLKLSQDGLNEEHNTLFDDGFIYINIGRLTKQKGQWNLIRCFKKVNEEKPDSRLIILGGGDLEEELKNLIKRLNLKGKVKILNTVTNVFPYLKKSDCFVFSSLSKASEMSLLKPSPKIYL